MRLHRTIRLLAGPLLAAGLASGAAAQSATAIAAINDAQGQPAGNARFLQYPGGVLIEVALINLPSGLHGIHLHETGACSPDFSAAGGHFAPNGNEHGLMAVATPHGGDLPNIAVDDAGRATSSFFNQRITLVEGETALLDDDGAAIIVHENPDNYMDVDSAGGRIACGVIERTDEAADGG